MKSREGLELSYDDVLIAPRFSDIRSRKEVDLTSHFLGIKLDLPIISSNMDSVTEHKLASSMIIGGATAALHRFMDIDKNVNEFTKTNHLVLNNKNYNNQYTNPFVSLGTNLNELERALALYEKGATHFIIDVAHGAAIQVVEQYDRLRSKLRDNAAIIVGNFDNAVSIECFNVNSKFHKKPDAFRVGIGPGSMCTTRIVTGCGGGSISTIIDCTRAGYPIIADGGIRSSGDIAKSLAAGASLVMIGQLLVGTYESPAEEVWDETDLLAKRYRGSASYDSYVSQNKVDKIRTPEGEKTLVPLVGTVQDVLNKLEGGIRSSFSYVGAKTLEQFKEYAKLRQVTFNSALESKAHGKR